MNKINTTLPAFIFLLLSPKVVFAQASELLPLSPNTVEIPGLSQPAQNITEQEGALIPGNEIPVESQTVPEPSASSSSANELPANFSNVKPAYQTEVLRKIGLVQKIMPGRLTIRSINGNEKTYNIASNIGSIPPISYGTLVSYKTDNNKLTRIKLPVVKDVFEGALIILDKEQLGLISVAGEQRVTRLSKDKIASMNLSIGQTVRVIEFEGIESKVYASPHGSNKAPVYIDEFPQETFTLNYDETLDETL